MTTNSRPVWLAVRLLVAWTKRLHMRESVGLNSRITRNILSLLEQVNLIVVFVYHCHVTVLSIRSKKSKEFGEHLEAWI
jgi:hypothetical protein